MLFLSSQENSTACPVAATTSAPPSGLLTSGAIAIGVIFGLLGLVAVAIFAVAMYKYCGTRKRFL